MRYVALIPLRGGSKGIPMKNIKPLDGSPLCDYAILAALKSGIFDKVVVSTDHKMIAAVAKCSGAEIIARPPELATDKAATEAVMLHTVATLNPSTFDVLVTIQATSPLTRAEDFVRAKEVFEKGGYDTLFSGTLTKHFLWREDEQGLIHPLTLDTVNRPMRQDWRGTILENGAFYFTERDFLLHYKTRVGGRIGCYLMPYSPDIDTLEDFDEAEKLLKLRRSEA